MNNKITKFYEDNKRTFITGGAAGVALLIGIFVIVGEDRKTFKEMVNSKVEKTTLTSGSFDDIGILGIKAEIRELKKEVNSIETEKDIKEKKYKREEDRLKNEIAKLKKSFSEQKKEMVELKSNNEEIIKNQEIRLIL